MAIVRRRVEDLDGVNWHRQRTMTKTGRTSPKNTDFTEWD